MTMQELFDKSVRGIIAQGGPSFETDEAGVKCVYRSPSGRRCAIGQWIPDYVYTPDMEGMGVPLVLRVCKIEVPYEFAGKLQKAHDQAAAKSSLGKYLVAADLSQFWQDWYFALKKIVFDWKLDGSVLQEIPISNQPTESVLG